MSFGFSKKKIEDVLPGKVVAGNPARIVNDITDLPYGKA